ncbi:hypothetical protein C8R47DRAFT_1221698 [Mycena vitilis]|nr:hypothetical protein C8R47DRAFT_1221698 [Mycena vitilis]
MVLRKEYAVILRQTPNLHRCDLEVLSDDHDIDPVPDITLPRLESFVMRPAYSAVTGIRIPDMFIVPALRSLKITGSLLGLNPVAALKSFISMASCKLGTVHITGRQSGTRNLLREFSTVEFSFDDADSDEGSSSHM